MKKSHQARLDASTSDGEMARSVRRLGYVPPCVKDAFSWLPHAYAMKGRGKKARPYWFWEVGQGDLAAPPMNDGLRCVTCVFREPEWSQTYAGCSYSWLNDHDGECQMYWKVEEAVAHSPALATFCRKPRLQYPELELRPYLADGRTYAELPDFSPHLPNRYIGLLNYREWVNNTPAMQAIYQCAEAERLRRFRQWEIDKTIEVKGAFQLNLFLD